MKIEYTKTAAKAVHSLDSRTKRRIKEAIQGLTEKPPKGDIKPLAGYKDGRFRLREGRYRIIYKYLYNRVEILYIMNIGVRGDIYK